MSEKEFSIEESEQLLANLKSGVPSEFEQLRSALNLLAHVPEMSPVASPTVLPSSISQPAAVVPIKSAKPRRTIVTSIAVLGLFASGSLAAAAVTGIGPAVFVNAGHSAARFVKDVVGGVSHVVTGNSSDSTQNQASGTSLGDAQRPGSTGSNPVGPGPTGPIANPLAPLAPPSNSDTNLSDEEKSALILPLISTLFPPTPTVTNPQDNESQKPNSSHETQAPSTEDSHPTAPSPEKTQPPEDQNQSDSNPSKVPKPESSAFPSDQPTADAPQPSDQPTEEN